MRVFNILKIYANFTIKVNYYFMVILRSEEKI